jgi:hypothetical protein
MAHTANASSVPDRFASTSTQRDRMPNAAGHRFADPRADARTDSSADSRADNRTTNGNGNGNGNGAGIGQRNPGRPRIIHQIAGRDVVLRRVATRRRLARIDPEAVERRAWRLTGGGASSPTNP